MITCRLHCQKPILPNDGIITHENTTYQIGTSIFLDNEENVILEKTSSNEKEKYEIDVDIDVEDDVILYARTKLVFNKNDGVVPEVINTGWSRVITLSPNIKKLSSSDVIVNTPSVTVKKNINNIYITASDFSLYGGTEKQFSSSYTITNTDNEIVVQRLNDEDNLKSILLDTELATGKIYKANVKHHTETTKGIDGSSFISTYNNLDTLISLESNEPFILNRKWYYRVKIFTNNYKNYDLEIRDYDGKILDTFIGVTELVNFILPTKDKYKQNEIYSVYLKINLMDGKSIDYQKVYSMVCNNNSIINYDFNITYDNKFKLLSDRDTNGISCSIERETYDGKIIGFDRNTNTLCLLQNNSIRQKIIDFYSFGKDEMVNYINILQLPNYDILVDVVVYVSKIPVTKFILFEYNSIKNQIKYVTEISRSKEKLNTAVNNSLVVTSDNRIYYIPARYYSNDSLTEETKLPLCELVLDIEHNPSYTKTYFITTDTENIKGKIYTLEDELATYKELTELVKKYVAAYNNNVDSVQNNKLFSNINNKVTYEFMVGELERINVLEENNIIDTDDKLNRDRILKKCGIIKIEETVDKKDVTTLSIKEYELPFFSKYNTSLFVDMYSNIYIYGGSYINYGNGEGDNEEYWKRDNNDIYLYDVINNKFSIFTTFPSTIPNTLYSLHAFLRADNKIAFFNACHSGESKNYSKFIILDVLPEQNNIVPNRWNIVDMNGELTIPFRSSVIYHNGVIERVSNTIQEYQKVLRYSPYDKNLPNFELEQNIVTDLIVNTGEVITIEDIYRYKKITILGDGVLRWVRPQGITELYSTDWIIDVDTIISQEQFKDKHCESILLLDGVQLKILSRY